MNLKINAQLKNPLAAAALGAFAMLLLVLLSRYSWWWMIAALLLIMLPWCWSQVRRLLCQERALAILFVLNAAQILQVTEYLVREVQVYVLGFVPDEAPGAFCTVLNCTWLHFSLSGILLPVGVLWMGLLLLKTRCGVKCWFASTALLIVAGWIVGEHFQAMTGASPGLLVYGGLLNKSIHIANPDLHFLYALLTCGLLLWTYRVLHRAMRIHPHPRQEATRPSSQEHLKPLPNPLQASLLSK